MHCLAEPVSLDEALRTVRELTARLQAVSDHRGAQHLALADVFDSVPEACLLAGADGLVLAANRACVELLGRPVSPGMAVAPLLWKAPVIASVRPVKDAFCWRLRPRA